MSVTNLSAIWNDLELCAREAGAMRVGASTLDDAHHELFAQWLERGHEAGMQYLRKSAGIRANPTGRYPWAKSVLAITVPYTPRRPDGPPGALATHVARYALGDDYHDVLDSMLRRIEDRLHDLAPEATTRRYVDTGPLSDRSYASQAGLGWIGRNGMLIDERKGSYFFIGTLLSSLENDLSPEIVADRCGTCRRCIEACPTDAILPDRTLDSNLCISYLTIEHRGPLPTGMESRLEGNAFGCDICQEVCPWNRFAPAGHPAFEPREAYTATPVTDLLRMSQETFSSLFRRSAIKRARLAGMTRNAAAITERGS